MTHWLKQMLLEAYNATGWLSIRDRQKEVVAWFIPNLWNYLESDCTDRTNIISLIRTFSKQMGYILFSHYLFVMEVAVFSTSLNKFKVCKSVHHHTIQINHQLDAGVSPVYYSDVYLQLNMFWASSRPSSGAQQLQ